MSSATSQLSLIPQQLETDTDRRDSLPMQDFRSFCCFFSLPPTTGDHDNGLLLLAHAVQPTHHYPLPTTQQQPPNTNTTWEILVPQVVLEEKRIRMTIIRMDLMNLKVKVLRSKQKKKKLMLPFLWMLPVKMIAVPLLRNPNRLS